MPDKRLTTGHVSFWNQRLVEWSMLALVIVLLLGVLAYKVRELHAQAELATVRSTLGNLRTAFVLDHLRRSVPSGAGAAVQNNPFELLEHRLPNYFGAASAAQALAAPAGSWVFDAACVCVGYLPLGTEWLQSPTGDVMAWYQISGAPGPLQLTAREVYVWQGQVMN
ncbi:hypothetical protein Rfer_3362 [Rhodoferax ferrireducens T118]|uniref:Uncharacterized protein n=1 Tax=Albidiferax ferrireducens (strain ATCC BAA-621 / DSM 15236 / T118) TaxID=338969 RepID=Q21T32_ALBFT|nr:hypothetical protein [Rhodoferax ferrireducens]ABD71071.1 hypothetical protein Rfer_3362 [Rhodoferax ferrireducens T118]